MLLLKTKRYQSNHHSCTRKPERKRRNPNPFSNNSKVLFFISISSFHGESWMPWRDAKFAEKKKKKREIKREDEESEDACVPQPKKREKRERRKIKRKIPTFICFNHEIRLNHSISKTKPKMGAIAATRICRAVIFRPSVEESRPCNTALPLQSPRNKHYVGDCRRCIFDDLSTWRVFLFFF